MTSGFPLKEPVMDPRIALLATSIACLAGAALAAEPPVLKSGLWEVTRTSTTWKAMRS